jgi:two-component system phosphate regulon sensor histidine kinase PhoR
MKNPTPKQIISITSLLTSLGGSITVIILMYYFGSSRPLLLGVMFFPILFGLSYLIFYYFLERFIYRRIKVIYKYIYDIKQPEAPKNIELKRDIIHDVEQQVSHWASHKKMEIEELKKMEKFRRDFIGNVSHELKTPVFNIQGYLETLLDEGRKDKRIYKKFISKALNNVNRLNLIINDLDRISETESGELILNLERFRIKELVTEVMETLEMQAIKSGIKLHLKDSFQKDYWVYADRERIRQVLSNLVINAIKYGNSGGEVLIAWYDMEQNILIEVSDNGIGIEAEHLSRLFERFYRVDKNRSRNKGGTGLGLSIVKHYIEAHRQTVHVRSTPGIGSTFGFTLQKASNI